MVRSKVDLKDLRLFAVECCVSPCAPMPLKSPRFEVMASEVAVVNVALTFFIILRQHLVMIPPNLRPFCEFILRARSIHLPLQAHHFSPQLDL